MERYEVAIIGAGMSGLAAGIRLAHFGRKVCLLEAHNAPGGLNSFYSKDGRKFDVGLHAMTNYVGPGERRAPLTKILRQLRIPWEALDLCPQKRSRIAFDGGDLRFGEARLQLAGYTAREAIRRRVDDPLLEDMLMCPIMYYGSATEDDMDFGQFAVLFRAIFFEGFARPYEGIRPIIRLLLQRYRECGGVRKMKTAVRRLECREGRVERLVAEDGRVFAADVTLSSAGLPETYALCDPPLSQGRKRPQPGPLAFAEAITILEGEPADLGWGEDTIVFFNSGEAFAFRNPDRPVDPRSGVLCIPNNFDYGERRLAEGVVRVTSLADRDCWFRFDEAAYRARKAQAFEEMRRGAARFVSPEPGWEGLERARDMFTPRTVRRYTRRFNGAIYGSETKLMDGRTPLSNLFLCGTDQGFLGIVGSLLSGITVANLHVLRGG